MSFSGKNNLRRSSVYILKDIFSDSNFFFGNEEENAKNSKKKYLIKLK